MKALVFLLAGLVCIGLLMGTVSSRRALPVGAVAWVWASKSASAQTTSPPPTTTDTEAPPAGEPGRQPQAGSGPSAGSPPAPVPFTPGETIEADEAVDFPVDI
jgi:hypothetical protein